MCPWDHRLTSNHRRRSLFTQERELEELQERIRQAEERLKMTVPVISQQPEASVESEPLPNWSFKPTTSSYNKRHTLTLFASMPAPILEEPEIAAPVYVAPQVPQQPAPVVSGDYAVMARPRARRRRARLEDHIYYEEEDVEEPSHSPEQRLSQVSTSSESNESCSDHAGDF